MDNITHSVAGLLLAEAAGQLRARQTHVAPSARLRAVAAVSSAIAANLPDADLLYYRRRRRSRSRTCSTTAGTRTP
jgi:hypothetical protein